jgi:hypothetical protein
MNDQHGNKLRAIFQAFLFAITLFGITGCDQIMGQLGLEDPGKKAAGKEAEGKAVGGGCRHSGRAIEDCYSVYTWLPKEAVFAGWREMDTYMRENSIETISPQLPPPPPPPDPKQKKKKKKAEGEEGKEPGPPKEESGGERPPPAEAPAKH